MLFITGIGLLLFVMVIPVSCSNSKKVVLAATTINGERLTGSRFYKLTAGWRWKERDSLAVKEILSGNRPGFMNRFTPVVSEITDSLGNTHRAVFHVLPDYCSVGTDADWARIPLTAMAAQKLADSLGCFLPTRKLVNLVYQQAKVQLEPVPMFAFRDSSITFWHHHLIIEGQRKGRTGLVAGIKKDVVFFNAALQPVSGRVAIYGWHKPGGIPIQPLYTRHVNWYVDYSHGARLVNRQVTVNGRKMDYTEVLRHPVYHQLLCDEVNCMLVPYPY